MPSGSELQNNEAQNYRKALDWEFWSRGGHGECHCNECPKAPLRRPYSEERTPSVPNNKKKASGGSPSTALRTACEPLGTAALGTSRRRPTALFFGFESSAGEFEMTPGVNKDVHSELKFTVFQRRGYQETAGV